MFCSYLHKKESGDVKHFSHHPTILWSPQTLERVPLLVEILFLIYLLNLLETLEWDNEASFNPDMCLKRKSVENYAQSYIFNISFLKTLEKPGKLGFK